jgi:hypothetical protein
VKGPNRASGFSPPIAGRSGKLSKGTFRKKADEPNSVRRFGALFRQILDAVIIAGDIRYWSKSEQALIALSISRNYPERT